jgi:hypothetical protein
MYFPLSISNIGLWLAVTAVILILTSEVLFSSPKYSMYFKIEKNRLRYAALACGIAFLITVALRVVQPTV